MERNEKFQLMDAELALAGTDPKDQERKKRLEQQRITVDKVLPVVDFLFRLFGVQCFPRGELVGITGKAKSGKTLVTSMLMACCAKRQVLAFRREREEPLHVLWIDTEQSEQSTQDILKNRIVPMVCPPAEQAPYVRQTDSDEDDDDGFLTFPQQLYDVFNLRGESWQERLPLLELAVRECQPDLVIVDGIRDLVGDINDGPLAQQVVEQLMRMASERQCCIVCVLHQNKSGEDHNLRGWIGTELLNKGYEVYVCEKLPDRSFSLEQSHTRKFDIINKLYYMMDGQGLPTQRGEPKKDKPSVKPSKIVGDIDISEVFQKAMKDTGTMRHDELINRVKELTGVKSFPQLSTLINEAINGHVIMKGTNINNHVIYSLIPY